MSDSFVRAIDALKAQINGYAPLVSFCLAAWGRPLVAMTAFKRRHEINQNQLPVIMIGRPSSKNHDYRAGEHWADHTVRLYAGFYQKDAAKALAESIRFEELICDAVMGEGEFTDMANAEITLSANDEGIGHPSYFTVIDLHVNYMRELTDVSDLDDFATLYSDIDMNPADGQLDGQDMIDLEVEE